jgi:hypothetical protein
MTWRRSNLSYYPTSMISLCQEGNKTSVSGEKVLNAGLLGSVRVVISLGVVL